MDQLLGPVITTLSLIAQTPDALLGPYAGLALSLFLNGLFYTGKVLSRTVVRREDFDALLKINADNAEGMRTLTKSMDELVTTMALVQKNDER